MMQRIGILSLKGGTGKSTISISLARAIKKCGHTVGLLDLDFTSPCAQILADPKTEIKVNSQEGFTPAKTEEGIEVFSMGLLAGEDTPMLLKGAKKGEIALQLTEDIKWNSPDYLIIDFPSGIQEQSITILQTLRPKKVILVAQPDVLSMGSLRRMVKALKLMKLPITGVIENMAKVQCPKCGFQICLFNDNLPNLAKKLGIDFLGNIPFYPN